MINKKSVITSVLIITLVTSVFAVGTVAAFSPKDKTCTEQSYFLGIELLPPACSNWEDIDLGGQTAEEVQSDIYSTAGTINQGTDSIIQSAKLIAEQGETVVWSDAKVEIIEAHENGKSEAEAKEIARKKVNEEYANTEKLLLDRITSVSNSLASTSAEVRRTENLSITDVMSINDGTNLQSVNNSTTKRTWTVQTGESINYSTTEVVSKSPCCGNNYRNWFSQNGGFSLSAKPVDSQLSAQTVANGSRNLRLLKEINTTASDTRNNVEQFTSDIYANYSTGELDASNFLSASDVAQNYNLGSQNGTGYATAQAALLGYPTNASVSMTIEFVSTGNQISGNLFATENPPTTAPNSSDPAWIPDHEYDVSNISGTIYMADAQTSRPSDWITVENDFEVVGITQATTGEKLNYTKPTSEVTLNTDATNLTRQLADLEAAMNNRSDVNDDEGLLPIGGGNSYLLYAFVGVIILFLAVMASRN
jgi:hypothetical protein